MLMRTMLGALVAVGLMLAAAEGAFAQQRAPEASAGATTPDAERVAAARELYMVAGGGKQLDTMIDTMFRGMAAQFAQQRPKDAKEIFSVFSLMGRKFKDRKEELLDIVAPIYAAEFSTEEMRELTRFYTTGIGKRFIDAQPGLTQKLLPRTMQWGQRLGEEAVEEARKELKKKGIDL